MQKGNFIAVDSLLATLPEEKRISCMSENSFWVIRAFVKKGKFDAVEKFLAHFGKSKQADILSSDNYSILSASSSKNADDSFFKFLLALKKGQKDAALRNGDYQILYNFAKNDNLHAVLDLLSEVENQEKTIIFRTLQDL